jgi:hypothetical protein
MFDNAILSLRVKLQELGNGTNVSPSLSGVTAFTITQDNNPLDTLQCFISLYETV